MARRRTVFLFIVFGAFLLLTSAAVVAQLGGSATCPDLVARALEAVNNLCSGQERNSACYGNTLVEAEFSSANASAAFSQEGDIANLGLLRSIQTSPLNDELTEWGVSVLSVQANLPGALPGQNALFMLIGGAEIESAVAPETAFEPVDPISVRAASDAPVLDAPQEGAAAVFVATAGQSLLADATAGDGAFVRVTLGDQFGWIARAALDDDPAVDGLPVYTPGQSFAPMQAFYLRTGIGGAQCAQAPSALVVQGPEDYMVDITANGANISLGSSVILETLPIDESKDSAKYAGQPGVGGLLRITVIDGHVTMTNDDGTVTELPEGYQSTICLTEPQDLGSDGESNDQTVTYVCGGWTEPEQIPDEFREAFGLVDDFPLIYPLDILSPTPTAVPTLPAPPRATSTPTPTIVPTNTPWPFIPSDTPIPPTQITGADLVVTASATLFQASQAAFVPRFLGAGQTTGQSWDFSLDITITNNGPETAYDVAIGGIFPDGTEGGGGSETGEYDSMSNTWYVGTLEPGQIANFSGWSFVWLDCGGSISSQLSITSSTPDPFPGGAGYSAIAECLPPPTVPATQEVTPDATPEITPPPPEQTPDATPQV